MSDKKWGFEKEYGHKTLPWKWHTSSGFPLHNPDPLRKKSFRPNHVPVYRDHLQSMSTPYTERAQSAEHCMSMYGCHKQMPWDHSLRSPRNPLPGNVTKEMRYLKEISPASGTYVPGASLSGASPRYSQTPRSARASSFAASRRRREPATGILIDDDDSISETSNSSSKWRTEPRMLV